MKRRPMNMRKSKRVFTATAKPSRLRANARKMHDRGGIVL